MDVLAALSEGKRGAVARSSDVAHYLNYTPSEMQLLVKALACGDPVVVAHSVHATHTLFKVNPELLRPYREQLLALLFERDQWELLEQLSKLLPHIGCTPSETEKLAARLLDIVENGQSSIARTCALEALVDVAELSSCVSACAEKAMQLALEKGTKAMQARARKLMAI